MKLYGDINDLLSSDKSAHKSIRLVDICSNVYGLNEADAIKKTNQILNSASQKKADACVEKN